MKMLFRGKFKKDEWEKEQVKLDEINGRLLSADERLRAWRDGGG